MRYPLFFFAAKNIVCCDNINVGHPENTFTEAGQPLARISMLISNSSVITAGSRFTIDTYFETKFFNMSLKIYIIRVSK